MPAGLVSPDDKRFALEQVLKSHTFQKSELLIRFLKYICECEISGNAGTITEYSIATGALGRPKDFSPEADSSVRSRAHALRRKLEDYYREELPSAGMRIVLPKGSYVPYFEAGQPELEVETDTVPAELEKPRRSQSPFILFGLGAFTMFLILLGVYLLVVRPEARDGSPAIVKQAWGPLLQPNADVLVVVAIPKQFWAREFESGETPRNERWYPHLSQDEALRHWYYESSTPPAGRTILLHPNVGSPLWGDMAGAMSAVKILAANGVKHQLLPERVLKSYALRGRNVMLFGNPEYSNSIRNALSNAPLQVRYDPVSRWEAVMNGKPGSGEPEAYRRAKGDDNLGVISVLVDDQGDSRPTQTVVFSGLTSAGTQAAQEFFSSQGSLNDLAARFKASGVAKWPQSYQVVIEASTDLNLPTKHRYRTHKIITP